MEKTLTVGFKSGAEATIVIDSQHPNTPRSLFREAYIKVGVRGVKRIGIKTTLNPEEITADKILITSNSTEFITVSPDTPE